MQQNSNDLNWQHWVHKTKKNKAETQHNTIYIGHHYTQTITNNVNKTSLLQTTGGKDEPNFLLETCQIISYL